MQKAHHNTANSLDVGMRNDHNDVTLPHMLIREVPGIADVVTRLDMITNNLCLPSNVILKW